MIKSKLIRLIISLVIILSILIPVNTAGAQAGPGEDVSGGIEDYVEITLRADGAPLPGGTAQLSFEATPFIEAPNLEIRWVIPEGVQFIGDDVDAYLNVTVNQPVQSGLTLLPPIRR